VWWLFGPLGLLIVVAMNKKEIGQTIDETVTENVGDYWTRFDSLFLKAQKDYGVSARWLKAFALNESNLGREDSVAAGFADPSDVEGSKSSDGKSWGLMQVTLPTGRDYDASITPQKLNNAAYSVDIAGQLIADLVDQFPPSDPRRLEWIVKSYNQGAGNSRKEKAGLIDGYAAAYWTRWQRNFQRVNDKPGGL
jgi:hypothetical protein